MLLLLVLLLIKSSSFYSRITGITFNLQNKQKHNQRFKQSVFGNAMSQSTPLTNTNTQKKHEHTSQHSHMKFFFIYFRIEFYTLFSVSFSKYKRLMTFSDIKKKQNKKKYDSIPNTKNKKKQKKLCSVGTAWKRY